jgi:enoyl-CoA hydratase/carnithine racemase
VLTVDRPEARNAMTPAMYFGVLYAVDLVNGDPSLAGLLLTGTGDVFVTGPTWAATTATAGPTCPACWAWTTHPSGPSAARASRWCAPPTG